MPGDRITCGDELTARNRAPGTFRSGSKTETGAERNRQELWIGELRDLLITIL